MTDSMRLPTVVVHREGGKGYRIINERDFDPAVHRLYEEPAPQVQVPVAVAKHDPVPAAPAARHDTKRSARR